MAFIYYSSIHRHSKWHPIRLGCWWKLFSFNIIRRFFFGYGTDHYSDYYFLEGAENPESSIKFNNYKSINKSWCILGWFKISKIHFSVYKTTRRIYPYPGWHLKGLCHAIFYLFKKLKLVFKYKWSSFAVPMNGKEGHMVRGLELEKLGSMFSSLNAMHVKITGFFMLFAISLKKESSHQLNSENNGPVSFVV